MNIKMEMATAKERFTYAVWHVLNEIEKEKLPYPNKKVYDYMVNINVKHQARFLFGLERDVIQFLENEKIIKEVGEPDIVEFGEEGTREYQVYEKHHLKPLNEFDEFYRQQTDLLRKFTEPSEGDEKSEPEQENIVLLKGKKRKIIPRKLPEDIKWENITVTFLNAHEVIIKVKEYTYHTNYEELGFQDERRKLPNKQWDLLRFLALNNGEISWGNNMKLTLKVRNSVKKQKQLLADTLKAYFKIIDEPFYPYKQENSYRIKIRLIPEPDADTSTSARLTGQDSLDDSEDKFGIKEYSKEEMPEVYDESNK